MVQAVTTAGTVIFPGFIRLSAANCRGVFGDKYIN
jgi:hypothetical protein